jgi:hypothetical protein
MVTAWAQIRSSFPVWKKDKFQPLSNEGGGGSLRKLELWLLSWLCAKFKITSKLSAELQTSRGRLGWRWEYFKAKCLSGVFFFELLN